MSLNEIRCLPSCGSTNTYAKEHIEEFGPVAAVYTTSQTSGRGRLGRLWTNAAGQALYYTAVLKVPMVQPETLPLFASLAVREQLRLRYGVECAIKWPNDLLLGGKKVVGILCEAVNYGTGGEGRAYLCGIGINLAQPQSYFDEAGLPYGTSLALQGAKVDLDADPSWLAEGSSGSSSRLVRPKVRKKWWVVRNCMGRPGTASRPASSMSFRSSRMPTV